MIVEVHNASMNLVFHAKMKHIQVNYYFNRDVLDMKSIDLVKVPMDENPSYLLMKILP